MPTPPLADTCATLDRLLSGSGPMALLAAKDHIRDLVAGVAELAASHETLQQRVALLESPDAET